MPHIDLSHAESPKLAAGGSVLEKLFCGSRIIDPSVLPEVCVMCSLSEAAKLTCFMVVAPVF